MEKLKLYGFNNLTKTLSFNIYDVCYAVTPEDKEKYIEYIDEQYNSTRLTEILVEVTLRRLYQALPNTLSPCSSVDGDGIQPRERCALVHQHQHIADKIAILLRHQRKGVGTGEHVAKVAPGKPIGLEALIFQCNQGIEISNGGGPDHPERSRNDGARI